MINPDIKIDAREFNAALALAVEESSRSASQVINAQAGYLAKRAFDLTLRANAAKYMHELGVIGYKLTKRKRGGFGKGKFILGGETHSSGRGKNKVTTTYGKGDTFAERIIRKRERDKGSPGGKMTDDEVMVKARKMIAARVRASGFIASGWIWAIRSLFNAYNAEGDKDAPRKPGGSMRGAKASGAPKGGATPAVLNLKLAVARVWNSAILSDGAMKIARSALEQALRVSAADMIQHVRNKLARKLKPLQPPKHRNG